MAASTSGAQDGQRSPLDGRSPLTAGSPLAPNAESAHSIRLGESRTVRYQIGARIQTGASPFSQVSLRMPVPNEWPEQSVSVVDEQIDDRAGRVTYRVLDSGVRQMMIAIPQVPAQSVADILITYEVAIRPILPPQQTSDLIRPKRLTKELKFSVGDAPQIFPRDRDLRKLVGELVSDDLPPWDALQILHAWILDHVTETVSKPQSTVDTLSQKQGCNEDRAALFVAMARAIRVPARMVMVEGGQHAEFCLEDPEGQTHWYPCTFRGSGEFGSLARPSVVFQKGDNIRVPESNQRMRLVPEFVHGKGRVAPQVEIVRRVVQ